MKAFRRQHCISALSTRGSKPLDKHLQDYFRANRALGSKDRQEIRTVRWQLFLDATRTSNSLGAASWQDRIDAFWQWKADGMKVDDTLPQYIRVSHPLALWEALVRSHGESKAATIARANNSQAPFTLRANLLQTSRGEVISAFSSQHIPTALCTHPTAFNILKRHSLTNEPMYLGGAIEVQDEASQIVASLVKPSAANNLVIDWCAGSGGTILLHDIRAPPLVIARQRIKRAGATNCKILPYSTRNSVTLRHKADWILVDAPCSATGTLRRNPEHRYAFAQELLQDYIVKQRAIFAAALPLLKEGGRIVYSTCSVLKEENEEQVVHFQSEHDLELDGTPFSSVPTIGGMDGLYGAVLKRRRRK